MDSAKSSAHSPQDRTTQSLKTRNAELENSNHLLLDELAECRRVEMALRERMEGFRWLLGSNVLGIMFARTDGRLTDANDAFLWMIDYSREDLRGAGVYWHDICTLEEAFNKCLEEGSFAPAELQFLTKGGEKVKLLFAAESALGQQGIVGFTHILPCQKSVFRSSSLA